MEVDLINNYDKHMEGVIKHNLCANKTPTLLLHACCAPCSSAVIERLSEYFHITMFFYNPNISPESEHEKRVSELKRLLNEMDLSNPIDVIVGDYDASLFLDAVKGLEDTGERGERCYKCYELRLRESARVAIAKEFDYYTTTLSISPHKVTDWLNEIGERVLSELQPDGKTKYLFSDFKKKNGYKRSIELSEIHNLYRQDYCGCSFSKHERELYKSNN